MDKNIIVFLAEDGGILEYISRDNDSDTIFSIARNISTYYGIKVTPHYASIQIGEEYTDKIHQDIGSSRPAVSVKVPLDECHKHGLCSDPSFKETEFCVLSRCRICPRRDK
jgi:hypothetical protein